jgi:hypothetical protein
MSPLQASTFLRKHFCPSPSTPFYSRRARYTTFKVTHCIAINYGITSSVMATSLLPSLVPMVANPHSFYFLRNFTTKTPTPLKSTTSSIDLFGFSMLCALPSSLHFLHCYHRYTSVLFLIQHVLSILSAGTHAATCRCRRLSPHHLVHFAMYTVFLCLDAHVLT